MYTIHHLSDLDTIMIHHLSDLEGHAKQVVLTLSAVKLRFNYPLQMRCFLRHTVPPIHILPITVLKKCLTWGGLLGTDRLNRLVIWKLFS